MLLMRFVQIQWVLLLALGELVIYGYKVTHHEKALIYRGKYLAANGFIPFLGQRPYASACDCSRIDILGLHIKVT
jgi:hypothetical protein